MMHPRARGGRARIEHFGPDTRRIEHALRVFRHAEQIAEGRTDCDADVLVASALLHDMGVKLSEHKLDHSNGKTQEEYGPPDKTEKVKQIIGNHHQETTGHGRVRLGRSFPTANRRVQVFGRAS